MEIVKQTFKNKLDTIYVNILMTMTLYKFNNYYKFICT